MRVVVRGGPGAVGRSAGDRRIRARLVVRIQDGQPIGARWPDRHVGCPGRGRKRHRLQVHSDRE
jgi:hypothetical protein